MPIKPSVVDTDTFVYVKTEYTKINERYFINLSKYKNILYGIVKQYLRPAEEIIYTATEEPLLQYPEYTFMNKQDIVENFIPGEVYNVGNYDIKVTEKDTLTPDDHFGSSFSLNRDDIINIKNGNSVTKDLGNGYSITFGGQNSE